MKILSKITSILVYVFLYAPLAVMIFFSFNAGKSTSVFSGFSLRWYVELFTNDRALVECLVNSLKLAVASALIATLIGTVAAIGIYKLKNKYVSGTILTVNNIPMMNPDIVTGVSMMLLFVFAGALIGLSERVNFTTLLIAHITFNIPYVVLNVLPKLKQSDPRLYEAAQDLGCTPTKAFFKVVMPQISGGIAAGLLMAFTLSFDDFVISYYTSGADYVTLPVYIYSMVKKTVTPDIYALYSIILVAILMLLIVYNSILSRDDVSARKAEKPKKGKKIVAIALAVVMVVSLVVCFTHNGTNVNVENLVGTYNMDLAGTELNVYNWAEYISDGSEGALDVVAAFEKLTGINVNYSTYESNEVMYSKIKSDSVSYDVIIPSDYMIARMKNEGMLQKLDYSKIPNYEYIDEQYKGLYFDTENEYCVPYSVGMVGLIYNTTMVKEAPTSWSVLWDPAYAGNILMFNNPRDTFAIAQQLLGISLNTTDKAEWDRAAAKLREQRSLVQGYVMDEVFNKMEDGNAALAPYYAGDFLTMQSINPDLAFVYPEEGVNIFVDAACIPTGAQNVEAAHMFINFLMEPEVALANAEYICYASPNTAVLNNDEYSLKDSEVLYPANADSIKKEYFEDINADIRKYYEDLWVSINLQQQ
ncbi:MAG: extracellular solute-binding protein, partial [Clostridia bacterium]|nr:extracellular solute-binding protein [Clostridia bacterium]